VFTAGCAQRLLNIDGYLPGKNVVIIGSGDIGLIMARRLTWSGAKVLCVVEIQPYPSGLTRNIVQCLEDNAIPLYLNHAVVSIEGKDRVEAVSIAPLVSGVLATEKSFTRKCDTVLLSVGLIPENELSRRANVTLNPDTAGPVVDQTLQTSTAGIFACGNVLHVHDLVDFVSEEAERCGANVVKYLEKRVNRDAAAVPVVTGSHIKYVVPNACTPSDESRFYMRPLVSRDTAELTLRQAETVIWSKKLRHVRPAEMISVTVSKEDAGKIVPDSPVAFSLQI
jgi:pyruvate/2-oxoglutarate dehydrogenase complex dihydrolipoamide dehydrogenase (E3) component